MTPERWQWIEGLFEQGLEIPSADRDRWLQSVCADASVRREVAQMLAADGMGEERFDGAIAAAAHTVLDNRPSTPQRIGPYRIVREVGVGGMGTVLLAERDDEHYREQVAIKLIRTGVESPMAWERFLRERQILAGLEQLRHWQESLSWWKKSQARRDANNGNPAVQTGIETARGPSAIRRPCGSA